MRSSTTCAGGVTRDSVTMSTRAGGVTRDSVTMSTRGVYCYAVGVLPGPSSGSFLVSREEPWATCTGVGFRVGPRHEPPGAHAVPMVPGSINTCCMTVGTSRIRLQSSRPMTVGTSRGRLQSSRPMTVTRNLRRC